MSTLKTAEQIQHEWNTDPRWAGITRNYTAAEYTGWLTDVGFVDPQVIPFEAPGANGIVIARKP